MERLKSLTLKLELFVGTDVLSAASDLCQLSDRIGVLCEADFNGVKLWALPGDNPLSLLDAYHEQIKLPDKHIKIARVR